MVNYRKNNYINIKNNTFNNIYSILFQIYFGVCVTVCVTASWVGATHCIKYLYLRRPFSTYPDNTVAMLPPETANVSVSVHPHYVSTLM